MRTKLFLSANRVIQGKKSIVLLGHVGTLQMFLRFFAGGQPLITFAGEVHKCLFDASNIFWKNTDWRFGGFQPAVQRAEGLLDTLLRRLTNVFAYLHAPTEANFGQPSSSQAPFQGWFQESVFGNEFLRLGAALRKPGLDKSQ